MTNDERPNDEGNPNDSNSKFVADAASVRQQISAIAYADASSVGHDDANLEVLNDEAECSSIKLIVPPR